MPDNLLIESTGLTSSDLNLATALPSDVISGKTFYAGGNKELQTGTLIQHTGYKLIAVYMDWLASTGFGSSGKPLMKILDTNKVTALSSGDFRNINTAANILTVNQPGTYHIYAYASASNDNQDSWLQLGGTMLAHAVNMNALTSIYDADLTLNGAATLNARMGGYSGCLAFMIFDIM